jgi:hypothetical protein
MNVYITSFGKPVEGTALEYVQRFVDLADRSEGRHSLQGDVENADVVLLLSGISDPREWSSAERDLWEKRSDDVFVYDPSDRASYLLPGVVVNLERKWNRLGRYRGYCFPWSNPYIEEIRNEWKGTPEYWIGFEGAPTSWLRKRMLSHGYRDERICIRDTSDHLEWNPHQEGWKERKRRYARGLLNSRFVLCPAGAGVSSIRIFETMQAGRVPVILSDDLVLPEGPAWDRFSIRLRENQYRDVVAGVADYMMQADAMGVAARLAWEEWFAPEVWFQRIGDSIEDIRMKRIRPEREWVKCWTWWRWRQRARQNLYSVIKRLILSALRLFGIRLRYFQR